MTGYCLDTDVISAVLKAAPPLHLIRRLAVTPAECQFTTVITVGELTYGAARRRNARLSERVQDLIHDAGVVLPFDEVAARTYGEFQATLEQAGQPLAEPDLRIASLALANEFTVVTAMCVISTASPGSRWRTGSRNPENRVGCDPSTVFRSLPGNLVPA